MKKVITLCAVAFVMVLGTLSASAQMNKVEINAMAAEKTQALHQLLKFNDEQRNEIYTVYQAYVEKKSNLRDKSNENPALKKLNTFRDEKFKLILSEEQFERYLKRKEE